MTEYKHWCGNCQIRIYIQRHENIVLNWRNCPFTCEYATDMRRKMDERIKNDSRPTLGELAEMVVNDVLEE